MALSWDEIRANALNFSKKWQDASNEEAEAQSFEREFFKVFGVADLLQVGQFEYKVPVEDGKGYIDYLWKKQIAIEMKSRGKNLDDATHQLDSYVVHLPPDDVPDLHMVCDFENIWLRRRSTGEHWKFKTKLLYKNVKKFANIAGYEPTREYDEGIEVNVKAAEKMAKLHDALKSHGYEGDDLEVYLVRLLFCLFADDTGIFEQDAFLSYIDNSKADGSDLSDRIGKLFEVLDMPPEARAKRTLLSNELKSFRYIDGGLFQKLLPTADFDAKMRQTLIDCCRFNWNDISPAIFGALFQGVMDQKQRRELGAHYTSEENILKLIKPLFLDDLWNEFEKVKTSPTQLEEFHNKIASLKFLDPACGCGNFLIITYRELRRLELEILKMSVDTKQRVLTLDFSDKLKVNVGQFYGIEIEDFPCQIARVGMWLMDHLMNMQAAELFGQYYARLPLSQSATILNADALTTDWETLVPKTELNYILGNPPFVGFTFMDAKQKEDTAIYFGKVKNVDFVCNWYIKAADYIFGTRVEVAFVSTNSICQGETLGAFWPLMLDKHIKINFAYRTFVWSNEGAHKAAVHCVIIGFSMLERDKKILTDENGQIQIVEHISPYLTNAGNIIVKSCPKPLMNYSQMLWGNKPTDDGNFILSESEKDKLIQDEPLSKQWIHLYIGSREFLHNEKRWCLWLKEANPSDIKKCPTVMKRIENVKKFRANSKAEATRIAAAFPTLFRQISQPDTDFLIIPETSSENREYVPMGFVKRDVIASNATKFIPDATLYHFGILMSSAHNSWMRAVAGRLKSDYRYSSDLVYNTFPWPEPTDEQRAAIESAAQGVLDARAKYPDSSLADLYDPLTMPPELLKAHKTLDRAVEKAYGASWHSEADCVADLMQRYQKLAK